jgi:hypothetical protein
LDVPVCLLEELADHENDGGGAIACYVVLGCGCSGDECGSWVLDGHLLEKYRSVFGQFDLAGAVDEHFDRA